MKLSVLVPTFNYDCSRLVRQLQQQLPQDGELIVGDDCSTDVDIICKNNEITSLTGCRIFRPDHNLGRAAIRNALAREAKGDWLLFIDADAEVCSPSFIKNYLDAIDHCSASDSIADNGDGIMVNGQWSMVNVICGGTGNLPQCPRPEARLRYDYEVAAEKRLTLEHRRRFAYAQFTTFNFLILRNTFLSICFDEHLHEYGHEDTLFGLELKRRGIPILHIENKLTHLGLEDADVYLEKTETALRSLASMDYELQQNARISVLALRLKRWHLLGFARTLFIIFKPLLRANLLGRHPRQMLFSLYKLGYYASIR
ncbi:MAG: glycosyltransferase family 2 protein [Bacteroidaceae bacterium]|nr:glycosyltransferase family 2 protein [Bacteroidaceae bacterium]